MEPSRQWSDAELADRLALAVLTFAFHRAWNSDSFAKSISRRLVWTEIPFHIHSLALLCWPLVSYTSQRVSEPPTRHGTARSRVQHTAPMRPSFRLSALPPTLRALLADPPLSTSLTVNGWLKSVRAHKNVAFAELSDGSGGGLQAVWKGKGRADGCVTKRVVQLPATALGRS
jgi:hypothetical protein